MYFVSFAVVGWVDVFTRKDYRDIIIESLIYKDNNVSNVLGDFKKFTSKQIIKSILENPVESRKEWMLEIFKKAGAENNRNIYYQFWQQDNQPKINFTPDFAAQKLEYIHSNPVEAGIVEKEEEYVYSSARNYFYGKQCGLLKTEFLI